MARDMELEGSKHGEEGTHSRRVRALKVAGSPVRRFLERRAKQLLVEAQCSEIRARVDGELQELHDLIWNDWGPNVFAAAKKRLEDGKE